jgi:hypothetical protein
MQESAAEGEVNSLEGKVSSMVGGAAQKAANKVGSAVDSLLKPLVRVLEGSMERYADPAGLVCVLLCCAQVGAAAASKVSGAISAAGTAASDVLIKAMMAVSEQAKQPCLPVFRRNQLLWGGAGSSRCGHTCKPASHPPTPASDRLLRMPR